MQAIIQQHHHRLDAVSDRLLSFIDTQAPLIADIEAGALRPRGKRIRALLTLLTGEALGCPESDCLTLAAAIELVHAASLLHDDVIDSAYQRRNQPTLNATHNNKVAILGGDYANVAAMRAIIAFKNHQMNTAATATLNALLYGELLQHQQQYDLTTTEQDYFTIIECKTGRLFALATEFSALLATVPSQLYTAITAFGFHLGIAYQLMDDWLDYQASTVQLGKPLGQDFKDGKPTLPLIIGLQNADAKEARVIKSHFLADTEQDFDEILTQLNTLGGLQYTRQQAALHTDTALGYLRYFPNNTARQQLEQLTCALLERAR